MVNLPLTTVGVRAVWPLALRHNPGTSLNGLTTMPWSGELADDRPLVPDNTDAAKELRKARATVRDLEAKIRHYNSDLSPSDQTFRAAVLLLAGLEYGHNIDLLARRTGYERPFVARIARRLIDNGVWRAGVTVADWSSDDEASGTFWNDVAVAQGKMCRRIGPDGRIEWAPAGFWNKNFQFVDPGADQRLATLYLDPKPTTIVEEPSSEEIIFQDPHGLEPADRDVADVAANEPGTIILGPFPGPNERTDAERSSEIPRLNDLFGDAVWIG